MGRETRNRDLRTGQWQVLAAAFLWGTTGTAQTFAPAGAEPPVLGGLRLVFGGGLLLALAFSRRQVFTGRRWPVWPLLGAAAGMAVFNLMYFSALARVGVAVGTTVFIGSTPVFSGVLGALFHREHLDRRWFTATTLAVLGCALLTLPGGSLRIDMAGMAMAVGAGAAYSTYNAFIKGLVRNHAPLAVMALISCLGAILLLPLLGSADLGWLSRSGGVGVVCYLGLFSTTVPYWLIAHGLKVVPLGRVATLNLAEPMVAAILGVLVVGERLSTAAVAGICLLFFSLVYLARGRRESWGEA